MPDDEGRALYEAARAVAVPGPLLEVGSWMGKSALYLAAAAAGDRPPGGHRRPPPRLRGAPARLGVPRPVAGRPARRADRHAAPLPAHRRRRRRRGRRRRRRRPVGGAGARCGRRRWRCCSSTAATPRSPPAATRTPGSPSSPSAARWRSTTSSPTPPTAGRRRTASTRGWSPPATSRSCPAPARCGCCGGCDDRSAGGRAGGGARPDRGADPRVRRAWSPRRRRPTPTTSTTPRARRSPSSGSRWSRCWSRRGAGWPTSTPPSPAGTPATTGVCETCGRPIARRAAGRPPGGAHLHRLRPLSRVTPPVRAAACGVCRRARARPPATPTPCSPGSRGTAAPARRVGKSRSTTT